ncbi:amidase family protein [Antrihabitans sp. NCIMB 15449]|uniref:Amidase family protein n=1 Tax=Antrihabitans spumae TaxID=3373370 RepID=A0ABW7JQX9_9NOCA
MTDLLSFDATDIADLIRRKEASSRDITTQLLDRISAVDPGINAVIASRAESALSEADAADAATARGDVLGPLHGVPMTIKEGFDVAGMATTWGNPAFEGIVAERDSTVVTRLKAAGAIIVGKTNLAFMLSDLQSANPLYGVTNNPLAPDRTPGGSSGGAAAALVARMAFLEFGTDLSGSIRNPASFCGVFGLRPTSETVPSTGMAPPGPADVPVGMMHLPAVGPLARSARDLRLALTVTAGPENPEAQAYSWQLPAPRHRRLQDFRVGYVLDDPTAPVSGEIIARLKETVDTLRALGCQVVEGWPSGIDPAQQFEDFGFQVQEFFALDGEGGVSHRDFVVAENRRLTVRAAWARYFETIDVFLCPSSIASAFPHENRSFEERTVTTDRGVRPYHELFFWTAAATYAGLPAASAPVGLDSDGLPVGVQIIGPHYEDDTVLTFAELGPFTAARLPG